MPIYVPKQIVEIYPTPESPLLFLAGPIRGGGDWQSEMAIEILRLKPKANIACPSRWDASHPLAKHLYQPFTQAENRQLVWERHYLNQAGLSEGTVGCIIFWLGCESKTSPHPGPEPYAMDTRREIGKFTAFLELMEVRMVVGGDRKFFGLDVILSELNMAYNQELPFYECMSDATSAALDIANR